MKPAINELFYNLLLVLFGPLTFALILKYLLLNLKVPGNVSSTIASLAFLYAAYKMLLFITG